ncbi:MAG: PD40 domain-containing protein [Herpetosiphonaceae bacterium]|nr:PD40 domain-containing protein [Herpetosiphonaceae bacterium]
MRMLRFSLKMLLLLALAACSPGGSPAATPVVASPATATTAASAPTVSAPTALSTTLSDLPTLALPTADPTAEVAGVLPAPLYYLVGQDGKDQIFRLEVDGITSSQITSEAAADGVREYAISPADGSLLYISGNDLIRTDKHGANRTVLVDGPAISDPNDLNAHHAGDITSPVWSPDGSQIAFGLGGVNVMAASGGTPALIMPHELQANPAMAALYRFAILRFPVAWSPDGSKLLTTFSYVPEGGFYSVLDMATTTAITITNPEGILCCSPVWSLSGATIYFANDVMGMVSVGMWEANAATGVVTRLVGTADGAPPWALVKAPLAVGNDAFLAFYRQTTDEALANGQTSAALTMTQINADGSTAPLRSTPTVAGQVLWSPDGRGAVVSGAAYEAALLEWLPSDDSPAVPLGTVGRNLRWGK